MTPVSKSCNRTEIWEKICRVNNKGSVIGTSEKPIVRNIYAINEQVLIL